MVNFPIACLGGITTFFALASVCNVRLTALVNERKNMRHLSRSLILALAAGCLVTACRKHNNNPPPDSLLQHRWHVVSLNGEVFRYVGQPADYWDFHNSDTLIQYISGKYDTMKYTYDSAAKRLVLNPFAPYPYALGFDVRTLTSSQLILAGANEPPNFPILDSLRR